MQMPDVNKKMESALIPMELAARLRKASLAKGITKSDIIQLALTRELSTVPLTSEDYQWMADEVKKNEEKRQLSARAASIDMETKLKVYRRILERRHLPEARIQEMMFAFQQRLERKIETNKRLQARLALKSQS